MNSHFGTNKVNRFLSNCIRDRQTVNVLFVYVSWYVYISVVLDV